MVGPVGNRYYSDNRMSKRKFCRSFERHASKIQDSRWSKNDVPHDDSKAVKVYVLSKKVRCENT